MISELDMKIEHQTLLVSGDLDINRLMSQLEATGRKILFVVGDWNLLLGTITDGDIRRWILGEGRLHGTAFDICNKHPYRVRRLHDKAAVRDDMLKGGFHCVPVIGECGELIDILFWEDLSGDEKPMVRRPDVTCPVVVMAGGRGLRLEPVTSILPKCLVPVGDRTILEFIIDSFRDHGADAFFVSLNYKARLVRAYFEELRPPYRLEFLEESRPCGTAGSLSQLRGRVPGETLIVTNCDIIVRHDFGDIVAQHVASGNDLTLVAAAKSVSIPYGVCELDAAGRLSAFREKPEMRFLVNTGLYILRPSVVDLIPEDTMFHMTDVIDRITRSGGKVGVFPISEGAWMDTGEWSEYRRTLSLLGVVP
jgi:dTDP-glucose pyrophosphorylase